MCETEASILVRSISKLFMF